jgi:SOS response regulatory protein OraA/RecX
MVRRLAMKGFDGAEIRAAVAGLRENGFLDDRRLAASLRRYAEESRHLSVNGARRFLIGRGIPGDISEEVARDIDEIDTAKRLVKKKIAGWRKHGRSGGDPLSDDVTLRKLHGALYRRGYPPEAINKALRELKDKEDSK